MVSRMTTELFHAQLEENIVRAADERKRHQTELQAISRNYESSLDSIERMEVKFKSDVIPDPSKIYIIRNKKFVCEKIEMEVKDDAIEPVYTGYFYMLS